MGEWMHGGRLIARVLKDEGVECLFALTGGHIAPIFDGCVSEGIRVVDVRHEQAASHAADAWARVTGIPGACAVTAGPGVTDAFTGVANAMYANSPLICFGGRNLLSEELRGGLQEMDHIAFMRNVTQWSKTCFETRRLAEYTGIAYRQAMAGRGGPVFLDIPMDVLMNGCDEEQVFWPDRYRHPNRPGGDPLRSVQRALEEPVGAVREVLSRVGLLPPEAPPAAAPADGERVDPPVTADEKALLGAFLDFQRATIVAKVQGLADHDARRALVPSGTSLAGIVKHLAFVERSWFQAVFLGREPDLPGPQASWRLEDWESPGGVVDFYRKECARSRAIVAGARLDDVALHPDHDETLRWILLHMIGETARHAGHMDVARELIDGTTGG